MPTNDNCTSEVAADYAEGCLSSFHSNLNENNMAQTEDQQLAEAQVWATLSVAAAIRESAANSGSWGPR